MADYKIDPVWLKRYGKEPTFDDIWRHFGYKPPVITEQLGEPKYSPEETCFAYEPKAKTGCEALKMQYCRYGECNFYKTREQYEEESAKYDTWKYAKKVNGGEPHEHYLRTY